MSLELLPLGPVVLAVAVFAAFVVSAAVGLGGSLVMVPTLVIALGPKEGVALAALLLAANNVLKVVVYRRSLALRRAAVVLACAVLGSLVGAALLVRVPEAVVTTAVLLALAAALLSERRRTSRWRTRGAPLLALGSGALSGFSGTSGPLKGVAVKCLALDRMHTVGAASAVSLGTDVAKTAVFTQAGLLGSSAWTVAAMAVPLMVVGTLTGRRLTRWLDERRWTAFFWVTMAGYSARLVLT